MVKHRAKKIKCSLYLYRGYYLVSTERMGRDKALDWVAVTSEALARRLLSGNRLRDDEEYVHIHNTMRDLKRDIDRELDRE